MTIEIEKIKKIIEVNNNLQIHISFPNYHHELLAELELKNAKIIEDVTDKFIISETISFNPIWSASTWQNLQIKNFNSISEATKILRNLNRDWACFSLNSHRRAILIQDSLPKKRLEKISFGDKLPKNPIGGWSLLDNNTIIFSQKTSSPFPNGIPNFNEDHENPPSRAYLKLWEVFTRFPELIPPENAKVIDMGACPGGWSWVLVSLKNKVISVDKAPIDETLQKNPQVQFIQDSAFGLRPQQIGEIDTFVSDIICYPPKLIELVQRWMEVNPAANFICSIKFQKETDYESLETLLKIPNSTVLHLFNNKHEVTWICKNH